VNDSAFGYGPVPGARSGIFVLYVIWSWRLRQVGCDGFQHGNMGEGKQPFSSGQNKILGDDGLKPTTTSKFGQIIQNVNILTAKAWEDLRANINGGDSIWLERFGARGITVPNACTKRNHSNFGLIGQGQMKFTFPT